MSFIIWRSNLTSQITSDICLRTYRQDPEMRFLCQYLWSQLLLHLFNIWPTHAPTSHFPHLQGLTLAHPVMDIKDFEILLLIGADYYWSIMEDTIIIMWRWAHSDEVETEIFTFWSSLPATTERPEHQHPTHFSCNVGRQRHQFFGI